MKAYKKYFFFVFFLARFCSRLTNFRNSLLKRWIPEISYVTDGNSLIYFLSEKKEATNKINSLQVIAIVTLN